VTDHPTPDPTTGTNGSPGGNLNGSSSSRPADSTNGSPNGGAYADAKSVAGLARDIEALRQSIDALSLDKLRELPISKLRRLPGRVNALAKVVADLAEAVNGASASAGGVASWLDLPAEVETTSAVLGELLAWMQVVYLRYPDAAAGLPDCWLWHPDVIEELLCLMQAWLAAYRDDKAAVSLAGDWHDRYRPGVVRRITTSAGRCSLENHQPRDGHPLPGAPVVPVEKAAEQIATWWAGARADPAPAPDEWHLATAAARRRPGARR
jgi:hypothetical protein